MERLNTMSTLNNQTEAKIIQTDPSAADNERDILASTALGFRYPKLSQFSVADLYSTEYE